MSIAQTWLAWCMRMARSKYGWTLCSRYFLLVLGFRYNASTPMRDISVAT